MPGGPRKRQAAKCTSSLRARSQLGCSARMCTFGGSVLRRLRDSQSNEDGFSVHRKSPAACRIRQPERSACAPCMGGLRNQRQSANERTAGGTWSLENESGLMNLLRLSISPLPAPAGWYALPLRLIIGFGFMQHGYAKLKQPCQLADAQESLTRARAGSISRKHAIGR